MFAGLSSKHSWHVSVRISGPADVDAAASVGVCRALYEARCGVAGFRPRVNGCCRVGVAEGLRSVVIPVSASARVEGVGA